jgi:hypothetical protein
MSKDDSRSPSPHERDLARLRSITSCEQLLVFCKDKKADLSPDSEGRNMASVISISLLREVWAAMDRIGCVVPQRPPLLRVDERRASIACLLEEDGKYPHPEDALDAYSTAIAWCAGQIAAVPDQAETEQAGGTVAGEDGKVRDGRDSAEAGQAEGADEDAENELTDRQKMILETMLEHEITSERRRKTRAEIVRLINRTHKPSTYNRDFAGLATRQYLRSREGPSGGVWMTSTGKAEAQRLCPPN